MEKIFHVTEPIQKWESNAVLGVLMDLFDIPMSGSGKKVYLIFNTVKLYTGFIDKVLQPDFGPTGSTTWLVKRVPQPCQVPDKITYLLPNGIEVELMVLNN